jgi:pimeloyl-ACP methyl ester carboxylesterase
MAARRLACAVLAAFALGGCSYLRYTGVQNRYEAMHQASPAQWLAKHMLGRDTYFVYGRLVEAPAAGIDRPIAVVAVSGRYRRDEIVEVNRVARAGSYYGMNLPAGEFRLLAVADLDRDGYWEPGETVGEATLRLDESAFPDKVAGDRDIALTGTQGPSAVMPGAPIPVPAEPDPQDSLFFPGGTLRTLDDPIFSDEIGQMGIYDPAAFMEAAPMMFYALEEDVGYKVPVVFVHGIGGSPRQFAAIVARMDRRRYKPWFFHYPAGRDLAQVARLFNDIFLSGNVIPDEGAPLVLVAHSLGGLVVREAMNLRAGTDQEVPVAEIITIATPFGGDSFARAGVANAPIVPPSWHDLDPAGPFVERLFRKPLPPSTAHYLLYAYKNQDVIGIGTDGTVPLAMQLTPAAVAQATARIGFRSEHTAILRDDKAVGTVIALISRARSRVPEEQMRYLLQGGFEVAPGPRYSSRERYFLSTYGWYMRGLANGQLQPVHPVQARFVDAVTGKAVPDGDFESAWLKFRFDYPAVAADTTEPR